MRESHLHLPHQSAGKLAFHCWKDSLVLEGKGWNPHFHLQEFFPHISIVSKRGSWRNPRSRESTTLPNKHACFQGSTVFPFKERIPISEGKVEPQLPWRVKKFWRKKRSGQIFSSVYERSFPLKDGKPWQEWHKHCKRKIPPCLLRVRERWMRRWFTSSTSLTSTWCKSMVVGEI